MAMRRPPRAGRGTPKPKKGFYVGTIRWYSKAKGHGFIAPAAAEEQTSVPRGVLGLPSRCPPAAHSQPPMRARARSMGRAVGLNCSVLRLRTWI